MAKQMTGAEMVVEALKDQGVEMVFGYPGGAVLPIYDAIFHQNKLRHILVRHEQGAAHAAEGYARSTGKVGVLLVTSGPGATNAITGLTDALMDSIPLVCITGQVPTHLIGSDAFQECDTTGITRSCTKHNYLVRKVDDLPRILHEAFHIASQRAARSGGRRHSEGRAIRHRRLQFPEEYPAQDLSAAAQGRPGARSARRRDDGGGEEAGFLHRRRRRQFRRHASTLLRELVRATGFPITSTLMGLGAYPASDKQWLGMLGMHGSFEANNAMHDCDLMICVGARFDDRITGRLDAFSPRSRKIHIDIDPSSINKNVKVDLGIVGDCAHVLEDMARLWREGSHRADPSALAKWWGAIDGWRARNSFGFRNSEKIIKPQHAVKRLYELTRGRDVYITTEVGQHQMWAAQHFAFEEPNRWMTSGGLGTMGYGLPAAIGAQLAHPRSLVVDIAGEASILMNMQEMSTAVQYRLPVKIFILNNQYMGMVRQWQELLHGGRYSESYTESLPDFVKLAEAYGAHGIRCADPAKLDAAIMEMVETPKPVIFDCLVDQKENCFPMIPSGKAHNEMLMAELEDDAGIELGNVIDEKGKMLV